jgi:hypothetical protein
MKFKFVQIKGLVSVKVGMGSLKNLLQNSRTTGPILARLGTDHL